jgi:hypothetical protein
MKHSKIQLFDWISNSENVELDWPKIQRELGVDHLEWLLKLPKNDCQLVVEKHDENYALVAEFYDTRLEVEYHLRWAK